MNESEESALSVQRLLLGAPAPRFWGLQPSVPPWSIWDHLRAGAPLSTPPETPVQLHGCQGHVKPRAVAAADGTLRCGHQRICPG